MRLFKKTVFWVLVLAALGGAFYLFDRKSEEKKADTEVKKRLFAFGPGDVTAFTIKKRGAVPVEARKEGSEWTLSLPVPAAGDRDAIGKYLDKLVNAKLDGVLYEKPPAGKLEEMGLKEPYLSVELTAGGQKKTISFGDTGPTLNVSFAALSSEERILRINTDIRADADKEAYDMRDKNILAFDPTRVKSFDIQWTGGERIVVDHPSEGKWHALGLPDGKTDFLRVMEMLVKLKKSGIKAFIDEDPKDLGLYGLKNPRLKLVFVDEKGVRQTLAVGSKDKQRRGYHAFRGGDRNVFLLDEDVVDSVPRNASDLEEKTDVAKRSP